MLKALGAEVVLTPGGRGDARRGAAGGRMVAENANYYMPQQFRTRPTRKSTAAPRPRRSGGTRKGRWTSWSRGGHRRDDHRRGRAAEGLQAGGEDGGRRAANSPVITQRRAGKPLQPGKHAIQGIGAGFIPKVLNLDIIDEVIAVRDENALETTRRLACEEGLMCGISCGAAAWAAIHLAKQSINAGRQIVAILPDLGERYLSSGVFSS